MRLFQAFPHLAKWLGKTSPGCRMRMRNTFLEQRLAQSSRHGARRDSRRLAVTSAGGVRVQLGRPTLGRREQRARSRVCENLMSVYTTVCSVSPPTQQFDPTSLKPLGPDVRRVTWCICHTVVFAHRVWGCSVMQNPWGLQPTLISACADNVSPRLQLGSCPWGNPQLVGPRGR